MKETIVVMLSAALGVKAGQLWGEEIRRRKYAEEQLAELRNQSPQTGSGMPEHRRQFKELRSVLNDAHKHIVAVSKALKITAP
jgi:hypothetical protein